MMLFPSMSAVLGTNETGVGLSAVFSSLEWSGVPPAETERDPVLSLFLVLGPTLVPLITAP